MKKLVFLLTLFTLLFSTSTFAKTIEATYKISYGIFGELGLAKTTLKLYEDNTYSIKVHAYATGIAKVLSSGKEETYESFGKVEDNKLIPTKFIKHSTNAYKKRYKEYTFDYNSNSISLYKTTNRLKTTYSPDLKPIQEWKQEVSLEKNSFFTSNDLLSLFFNIKQMVPNFEQGCKYDLKAVGANSNNGSLSIFVPKGEAYHELDSALDTNDTKFIASINQKIFASQKGELYISLNEAGFCNKAVLKDVLIFGDIVGEIINFNIKES